MKPHVKMTDEDEREVRKKNNQYRIEFDPDLLNFSSSILYRPMNRFGAWIVQDLDFVGAIQIMTNRPSIGKMKNVP